MTEVAGAGALDGVKVLEVSQFAYVPAAGATLADWGADVIKVVHPIFGDVMNTASPSGIAPLEDGTAFLWEFVNRNKRSIGIDLAQPEGRDLLLELARSSDVMITNLLPAARAKFGVDVDDVRAVNPEIIYARGSGHGPLGPDADARGFDSVSYWARSGWAEPIARSVDRFVYQPGPGCGDVTAGFMLAAGVVAALLKRERGGGSSVVDGSLLSAGMWGIGPSIAASSLHGLDGVRLREREEPGNALVHAYRTKDDRWIVLAGIMHEDGFAELAERLGRAWWAADPKFHSHASRFENHLAFLAELDSAFAERTLDEWVDRLRGMKMPFSVVQTASEAAADRQAVANNFVRDMTTNTGRPMKMTATPILFDEQSPAVVAAPAPGQNTEEILLEHGVEWERIDELKSAKVIT
jgi:crotonobetainyl-CoA:carnitine CoA-transferase CaiB-like acyl-CoA transferase